MPPLCAGCDCGNNATCDEKLFFRIPKIIKNGNKTDEELSGECCMLWFKNIHRKDLTEEKASYTCVCGDHFISGEPANLRDKTNSDWAPTLKLGHDKIKTKTHLAVSRINRINERSIKKARLEATQTLASLDIQEQCGSTLPDIPESKPSQQRGTLKLVARQNSLGYKHLKWSTAIEM